MKIRITTHSGEEDIFDVEDFNAEDITEKRNDPSLDSIRIGEASYSRIDLKTVKPYVDSGIAE